MSRGSGRLRETPPLTLYCLGVLVPPEILQGYGGRLFLGLAFLHKIQRFGAPPRTPAGGQPPAPPRPRRVVFLALIYIKMSRGSGRLREASPLTLKCAGLLGSLRVPQGYGGKQLEAVSGLGSVHKIQRFGAPPRTPAGGQPPAPPRPKREASLGPIYI